MAATYDISKDLKEASAMARGLSDYVRGDELYGNAGGGFFSRMPSLTVGALLLRLRRLHALRGDLNERQQKTLDEAVNAYETVRKEWTTHYEEKLLREAKSRIDAMQGFFRECRDSMSRCAGIYRPELLRRSIVQEIERELQELRVEDDELQDKIRGADGRLRAFLRDDQFQWDERLQDLYPKSEFWWLYQKPPQEL